MTDPLQAFRDRTEPVTLPSMHHWWKLGRERIGINVYGADCREVMALLTRFFVLDKMGPVVAQLHIIDGGERPELPPRGTTKVLGCDDWVAVYDSVAMEAYVWLKSLDGAAAWGPETPLHVPMGWIAEQHGSALAHAAAFGKNGKVALIVGPPGVGKSTLAVRAAMRGLEYYGDDRVLIGPSGKSAHALFSSAKCFVKDLTPEHDKFDTGQRVRGKAILQLPVTEKVGVITMVVVPTRVPDHDPVAHGTYLWNIGSATALRALAPSSLLQLPGLSQPSLDIFSKVVRESNTFALRWGSDVDRAIDSIIDLL